MVVSCYNIIYCIYFLFVKYIVFFIIIVTNMCICDIKNTGYVNINDKNFGKKYVTQIS